jgi:hypothetical protein
MIAQLAGKEKQRHERERRNRELDNEAEKRLGRVLLSYLHGWPDRSNLGSGEAENKYSSMSQLWGS